MYLVSTLIYASYLMMDSLNHGFRGHDAREEAVRGHLITGLLCPCPEDFASS